MTDWLGKHMIIELYGCSSRIINNVEQVKDHVLEAVRLSGATVIEPFFHHFPPNGVSGIVVVAESHFSVHTWPEIGYCALDIFTCGQDVDSQKALDYLKDKFCAAGSSSIKIMRGPDGPLLAEEDCQN